MVLMSAGKAARSQAKIVTRTNVCGGPKKAGIAPRIGWFMQNNPKLIGVQQSVPKLCIVSNVIQTQKYGYRATHGGNMG